MLVGGKVGAHTRDTKTKTDRETSLKSEKESRGLSDHLIGQIPLCFVLFFLSFVILPHFDFKGRASVKGLRLRVTSAVLCCLLFSCVVFCCHI
jgi:hypothetical protein